jgi:hypothetical protein
MTLESTPSYILYIDFKSNIPNYIRPIWMNYAAASCGVSNLRQLFEQPQLLYV